MLTVTVGLDGSGKRSTRKPFGRRYSVMPSTSATFVGATVGALNAEAGSAGLLRFGVSTPVRAGAGGAARGASAGMDLGGAAGVDSGAGVVAGFFGSGAFCANASGRKKATRSAAGRRVMAGSTSGRLGIISG